MHETDSPLRTRIHRTTCPVTGRAIYVRLTNKPIPRCAPPARRQEPAKSFGDLWPTERSRKSARPAGVTIFAALATALTLSLSGCASFPDPSAIEGEVAPNGAYRLRVEFDSAGKQLPINKGGYAK